MTILVIDFMNSCHRARSGFVAGDHAVTYNFFRQFRALVEQFSPTKVYVVLEGHPEARHDLLKEYKANRVVEANDPRAAELAKFFKQVDECKDLLTKHFPVSVVRHPKHEADDTIANLISRAPKTTHWVIASSDSDFTQLLQTHKNVRLYNLVRKEFVEAPTDYDYVVWKSLRGDATDNIPGLPGVGDKTAEKMARKAAEGSSLFVEFLAKDDYADLFERNFSLITFAKWTDEEAADMTSSAPHRDWDTVKTAFDSFGFKSITNDKSWNKFVSTFDCLFGDKESE